MNGNEVGQRWEARRQVLRRRGDGIANTDTYEVKKIPDATARAFVVEHHYTGSYPVAVEAYGVFVDSRLSGVAVLSVPVNPRAITSVWGPGSDGLELGRFVLSPELPYNAESYVISRVHRLVKKARPQLDGVIAFSDPMPRRSPSGIWSPGHVGQIYQATNMVYLGRSASRNLHFTESGTVLHARSLSKIRNGESGWKGGIQQLVEAGAVPPKCFEADTPDLDELRAWLPTQLARICEVRAHPGNLKYAASYRRTPLTTPAQPYVKRAPAPDTLFASSSDAQTAIRTVIPGMAR